MSTSAPITDDLVAVRTAELAELIARADRRWFSIPTAAAYCDLSPKSLRNLLAAGKLTAHRAVRGKILIDRIELDSLIASATSRPKCSRGCGARVK